MKYLTFLVAVAFALLFSCEQPTREEIQFHGFAEPDTILNYQDSYCHFVASGLVEQLANGTVNSANFILTTTSHPYKHETELTKTNFYLSDTIEHGVFHELNQVDNYPEQFDTPDENYLFFGELEVYYLNGDTISYSDTITLTITNPLFNEKMDGKIIDGKRTGEWLDYYDNDHKELARKSYFENGLRHGADTVYKLNKVAIISNWHNGKKHGVFQHFRFGYKQSDVSFEDGIPTTPLRYFNSKREVIDSVDLKSL